MKVLFKYLSNYKGLVALALLFAAINQIFSLFDPYILGNYIIDPIAKSPHVRYVDGVAMERTVEYFIRDAALGLGLIIGTAMISRIAKAFQDYVVNVIIQKLGAQIFIDGLQHVLGLPFGEFEDQRSGETLAILEKVRLDVEKLISSFVNVLFTSLIGMTFVIFYAMSLNSSLVLVYFGGAVTLGVIMSFLSKRIKVIQRDIVSQTTALAGSTTESLRNIELVKSLGLTKQETQRLNNNTFKILKLELKKVKSLRTISFIQGTTVNFLRQCIMFALLWFIFKDQLTLGQMVTMQFYSFFIFGPLQELGNIILAYREAEASLENFDKLMQKPQEPIPPHPQKIGTIDELRFEHVTFQHKTSGKPALDDISFTVKRGETIAFVGPSGSGKTTLVKILVGLYRPKQGAIFYNNIQHDAIDIYELRQQLGFVTQDTQLFSGTIKENLLFVNPQATTQELQTVLTQAATENLLRRAEDGLNTVIGEGGLKLSGGERQRLSIARALLRNPHLLIFDEATSALDSITEESINATVQNIIKERSMITVMIAHRLSTIMNADRIYVLEQGKIVETGDHNTLLAEKGLYYAMWRQQIGERKK